MMLLNLNRPRHFSASYVDMKNGTTLSEIVHPLRMLRRPRTRRLARFLRSLVPSAASAAAVITELNDVDDLPRSLGTYFQGLLF